MGAFDFNMKLRFCVVLLTGIAIAGCAFNDYQFNNGYKIIRSNPNENVIVSSNNHIVVGPNLVSYSEIDDVIVGLIDEPHYANKNDGIKTIEGAKGYFILNTKDGNIRRGLSKSLFELELKKRNIKEPMMKVP